MKLLNNMKSNYFLISFSFIYLLTGLTWAYAQETIIIVEDISGKMSDQALAEGQELLMFPNPGVDFIRVIPESSEEAYTVEVMTLWGKKLDERYLSEENIPLNGFKLDVRSLVPNTYLVRVSFSSHIIVRRFIVSR